ncbi:MAG: hypothetical protein IKQ54_08915 [Oscillospiraceae bacterium]|nr:hypothetical protein [Oscillospiraceae bacterium]
MKKIWKNSKKASEAVPPFHPVFYSGITKDARSGFDIFKRYEYKKNTGDGKTQGTVLCVD